MPAQPLRLRAEDTTDLTVLAAALQDAIFVVGDLAFDARERRFIASVNRFRWEDTRRKMEAIRVALLGDPNGEPGFERTRFGYFGDMGRMPTTGAAVQRFPSKPVSVAKTAPIYFTNGSCPLRSRVRQDHYNCTRRCTR